MGFKIPPAFLIKFGSIDDEHESLAKRANELLVISQNGSAQHFENEFEALIAAFETHFMNEESLMKNAGYGGLNWHANHHDEVLVKVRAQYEACRRKGKVDPSDIYACFDQVINDIAKADLKFGEFLDATNGRRDA